jgi:hypothetical protein
MAVGREAVGRLVFRKSQVPGFQAGGMADGYAFSTYSLDSRPISDIKCCKKSYTPIASESACKPTITQLNQDQIFFATLHRENYSDPDLPDYEIKTSNRPRFSVNASDP